MNRILFLTFIILGTRTLPKEVPPPGALSHEHIVWIDYDEEE